MAKIGPPRIDFRPDRPYLGIRFRAPFKGMFEIVTAHSKEIHAWFAAQGIRPAGPPFLRYNVIDMAGEMDLSYGIPVATALPGDDRVRPEILPGGRFASLVYTGGGRAANRTLIEWVRATEGDVFDRWDSDRGDNFRSRYETYLTDPKIEPRKSRWDIEVAIKLKD